MGMFMEILGSLFGKCVGVGRSGNGKYITLWYMGLWKGPGNTFRKHIFLGLGCRI